MAQTVAIVGAGGNMGGRVSHALHEEPAYEVLHVEDYPPALERLRERGVEVVTAETALPQADVAVLAISDHLIGGVAPGVVPHLKSGAMIVCLDPAAPYANKIPLRDDLALFVTHPAHPPVFNDEVDMAARRDYFGSGLAKQSIVSCLVQGSEDDYVRGEALSRQIFKPILRSHRVTLEQFVMLEPALSETVAATCITVIREAMDEAIRRGVPAEAARDFILGHVNIPLAIMFNEIEWDFSAGAKTAISEAKKDIFQPDWKKVFEREALQKSVAKIVGDA